MTRDQHGQYSGYVDIDESAFQPPVQVKLPARSHPGLLAAGLGAAVVGAAACTRTGRRALVLVAILAGLWLWQASTAPDKSPEMAGSSEPVKASPAPAVRVERALPVEEPVRRGILVRIPVK